MATMPSFPFSFVLVGAGNVGSAVSELFRREGNTCIGVSSRSLDSSRRASALFGAPTFEIFDIPPADVYLLGVSDAGLEEVAGRLPLAGDTRPVVIHLAGSFGIAPLEQATQRGAIPCALHPVQACPDLDTALERLPGSAWGVTCAADARAWAHRLVSDVLRGSPVDVPEDARPAWHAAAVTTSNGISALLGLAERFLAELGISDPEKVLGPLALGTVRNALAGGGGAAALTGPVVRGEGDSLRRHVAALERMSPQDANGYRLIAELIRVVARDAGRIDDYTSEAMRQALGGAR